MMYDQQFVLAVIHDGCPVREIGGKVTLPFNSEYKIRLKNKNSVRAKARVWIDGRKASTLGDFIIHPGETLDLERFLDESMSEGRRFKFVPISDGRVNDPTDSDNGIIKVEFYKENISADWNIIDISTHKLEIPKPGQPYPKDNGPNWGYNPTYDSAGAPLTGGGRGSSCSTQTFTSSNLVSNSNIINCNYVAPASSPGQAGATVEGGHSNQNFVVGDEFETDMFPTTLTLRVQGPLGNVGPPELVRKQRRPRPQKKRRFCPFCGKRKQRATRFCGGCGEEFNRSR